MNSTSRRSLGVYPIKKGLAEEMGAIDRKGRGYSLDWRDIGMDVTGYGTTLEKEKEEQRRSPLPSGHRFFQDCEREVHARMIERMMNLTDTSSWFVTQTFENYVTPKKAWWMENRWLSRIAEGYADSIGAPGLRWVVAQEWQKRQVIHFHSILNGVRLDSLGRKRWENRWQGIGGGYARIYDARKLPAPCLAKYCSKTQGGELRWGGHWRGITFPKSIGCCQTKLHGLPATASIGFSRLDGAALGAIPRCLMGLLSLIIYGREI